MDKDLESAISTIAVHSTHLSGVKCAEVISCLNLIRHYLGMCPPLGDLPPGSIVMDRVTGTTFMRGLKPEDDYFWHFGSENPIPLAELVDSTTYTDRFTLLRYGMSPVKRIG